MTATLFGDTPTADADRSLSDTASVSRPKALERNKNHIIPAEKDAIARRIKRSTVIETSDQRVTRSVGSQLSTCLAFEPYRMTTPAWIRISTPRVAMTRMRVLARSRGRRIIQ